MSETFGLIFKRDGWEHYPSLAKFLECNPSISKDKASELMAKGTLRENKYPPIQPTATNEKERNSMDKSR